MRIEHDLLEEHEISSRAYWGIHTARAVENFPITGTSIGRRPHLVNALAAVRMSAAARANSALGVLESRKAEAIVRACTLIRGGALHDQFVVDELQGGAGTSTNIRSDLIERSRAIKKLLAWHLKCSSRVMMPFHRPLARNMSRTVCQRRTRPSTAWSANRC